LQRVQEKCCPKLYPRKRLQRLATKKSVAIYTIATILDILQHFLGVETASKISSAVTELCCGYRISSAGADVLTNKAVTGATLDISGQRFRVNHVVMPGLVLDIIIRMNKMTDWVAVIDAGQRTLSLKDPQGEGILQVRLPRRFDFASLSCAVQVVPLEHILVVCEFPDVFLEELLGLPSDREVEFAI